MFTNLVAARAQMGVSLVFHVIFSVLGVGLPLLLCLAEGLALWRKDGTWLSLSRQWTKAFSALFAIGAVSGAIVEFEITLLWSGLVKNALDHLEELRTAERPYLEGRPVGCIVIADGVQAVGTTLSSLRSIVHALRGWPTPFGLAMDSRALQAEPSDRSERESQGVRLLATEVVRFATMQISMRSARLESTAAE